MFRNKCYLAQKTSFESVNAWNLLKYLILLQSTLIVLFAICY